MHINLGEPIVSNITIASYKIISLRFVCCEIAGEEKIRLIAELCPCDSEDGMIMERPPKTVAVSDLVTELNVEDQTKFNNFMDVLSTLILGKL